MATLRLVIAVLFLASIGVVSLGRAQAQRLYRFKNGVRLAGDSGSKGRLEISSVDSWFTTTVGKAAWSPVCDSQLFTDDDALVMCQMLNYTYGRKYYSRFTTAPRNETGKLYIGSLICDVRTFSPPPPARSPPPSPPSSFKKSIFPSVSGRRRHLRHGSATAASRELYTPLIGSINAPKSAPYNCRIRPGGCNSTGPFVGIECSHTPMNSASPPPPMPPNPPPAPPAVSSFIRFYGPKLSDRTLAQGDLEPNLVDEDNMFGTLYGRFEVQVSFNGSLVWAPVCASNGTSSFLAYMTAGVGCSQLYDWPKPFDGGIGMVMGQISQASIPIPEAAEGEDDFDPVRVLAWVTVTGPGKTWDAQSIQEMNFTVSATKCTSGLLFAVVCHVFGE